MKIDAKIADLAGYKGGALIVNLFEKINKPGGATAAVDAALGGIIARKIKLGEFTGKLGTALVTPGGPLGVENVIVVGLGPRDKFDLETVRKAAATAALRCKALRTETAATVLHGAGAGGIAPEDAARAIAEGAILALYKFDKYISKDPDNKDKPFNRLTIIDRDKKNLPKINAGIRLGTILADAANTERDLVNEPASVMTPERLAQAARKIARDGGLQIKVLGKPEIEKLKMGGVLNVSRGSAQPPRFIVMSYKGAPKSKKTVGLIGKGVTFDSGGLCIKPPNSMDDMKGDMTGAACMMCVMKAISQLKPKINVTAVMPAVENMTGGNAYKVGDIFQAMNGKTIEVLNTDAEGRLILADAICYAKKLGMSPLIDAATLTGACVVALGTFCAGAFGNDDELIDSIIATGKKTGEKYWRLPTFDEFKEVIKSDIADIKNIGDRYAGASTAAMFLAFFYGDDVPWVHLDIAGPMTSSKDSYYIRKGATGTTVRTLTMWLLDRARK